jgi:hypothetical protein
VAVQLDGVAAAAGSYCDYASLYGVVSQRMTSMIILMMIGWRYHHQF